MAESIEAAPCIEAARLSEAAPCIEAARLPEEERCEAAAFVSLVAAADVAGDARPLGRCARYHGDDDRVPTKQGSTAIGGSDEAAAVRGH